MSKAIKTSIFILFILLALSIICFVVVFLQKQTIEQSNQALMTQVGEFENQELKLQRQIQDLTAQVKDLEVTIKQKEDQAATLKTKAESAEGELEKIASEINKLRDERDDLQKRVKNVSEARDQLMKELQERPEKIVYKDKIVEKIVEVPVASPVASPTESQQMAQEPAPAADVSPTAMAAEATPAAPIQIDRSHEKEQEEYWAQILKQKASLELKLDQFRKDLDSKQMEIVELKKQNADYKLEVSRLANERDEIVRQIKHGEDLANNLSIELARAKNESKFVQQQADKIKSENQDLRGNIKSLNNQKLALEKSVTQLAEEKKLIEKKLIETEQVIQGRIDDIWQIKTDLDKRFATLPVSQASNQVELPPIIVNAGNNGSRVSSGQPTAAVALAQSSSRGGSVVSVNEANNFVIIDVGETDGIRLGDEFHVYRGDHQVATVEVIQIRKDISAADIKQKATGLKVGDVVGL